MALRLIDERREKHANARDELIFRIRTIGNQSFANDDVLELFDDVVNAFMPEDFYLEVNRETSKVSLEDGGFVRISGTIFNYRHERVGCLIRMIFPSRNVVVHELLEIEPPHRNKRIAPKITRQSCAYYDAIKITHIELYAAGATGRYYWATCGFSFAEPEEDLEYLRNHFAACSKALKRNYAFSHIEEPARLATFAYDDEVSMEELYHALNETNDFYLTEETFQNCAEGNGLRYSEKIPFGKLVMLTCPSGWKGEINISDPQERAILEFWLKSKID